MSCQRRRYSDNNEDKDIHTLSLSFKFARTLSHAVLLLHSPSHSPTLSLILARFLFHALCHARTLSLELSRTAHSTIIAIYEHYQYNLAIIIFDVKLGIIDPRVGDSVTLCLQTQFWTFVVMTNSLLPGLPNIVATYDYFLIWECQLLKMVKLSKRSKHWNQKTPRSQALAPQGPRRGE